MNIFLVAGHSSTDPGAVANNTTEHIEVWAIAEEVYANLLLKGLNVFLIPQNCDLLKQIDAINAMGTEDDVLFNIHMNSGTTSSGIMVFCYSGSEESRNRSTIIINDLCALTGLANLGVQGDTESRLKRLGIIRDTKPWAYLIEYGFVTNPDDIGIIRSKGAEALTTTICHYLQKYNHLTTTSCETPLKNKVVGIMAQINNIILHLPKEDQGQRNTIEDVIKTLKLLQRKRTAITREDLNKVIELCKWEQYTPDNNISFVLHQLITLQQDLTQRTACA